MSQCSGGSPTPSQSFAYPVLEAEGCFRLVKLHPGGHGETILCDLISDRWTDETIAYEALSYAWGSKAVQRSIQVNGHQFSVTSNLHGALSRLRRRDEIRTLWIDAMCINQEDLDERNTQVRYMGEIYQNAQCVVVWLGESDDDSDDAVFFMNSLYENLDGCDPYLSEKGGGMPSNAAGRLLRHGSIYEYLQYPYTHSWEKVCRLLQREWWQRAWIVQEFINGKEITIQLGHRTVRWPVLAIFITFIQSAIEAIPAMSLIVGSAAGAVADAYDLVYDRRNKPSDGMNLQTLLCSQRHRQCANPLDKIYSVLSLIEENSRHAFTPDYSSSTSLVYGMAVKTCYESSLRLEILCESMSYETSKSFPSWCPDWTMPRIRSQLGGLPSASRYRASGLTSGLLSNGSARFSENMEILTLRECFELDIVARVGIQQCDEEFHWWYESGEARCNWNMLVVAKALLEEGINVRDHDGKPFLNSELRGSNVEWIQRALLCTLVADLIQADGKVQRDLIFEMALEESLEWPAEREKYFQQARDRTWGRTLLLSQKGLLGLVPRGTQVGDHIFVISGCSVPIILRRGDDGSFSWIGDSYVHGIMNGLRKVLLSGLQYEQKEEIVIR